MTVVNEPFALDMCFGRQGMDLSHSPVGFALRVQSGMASVLALVKRSFSKTALIAVIAPSAENWGNAPVLSITLTVRNPSNRDSHFECKMTNTRAGVSVQGTIFIANKSVPGLGSYDHRRERSILQKITKPNGKVGIDCESIFELGKTAIAHQNV